MEKRTRAEILKEVECNQLIREKVVKGEKVVCPKCGEVLFYSGKQSDKHPGVYCPNDDFEILIEYY